MAIPERFSLDDFREVFVSHNQTFDQHLQRVITKYPKTGHLDLDRALPLAHRIEVEGTMLEITTVRELGPDRFRHEFVEIRDE